MQEGKAGENIKSSSPAVRRISGPIIRATGLGSAGLYDLVEVGEKRVIGEIIRLEEDEAVIQVYEETSGLKTGCPVFSTGRPLCALLGPGLMGTIYDGIQRPLSLLYEKDGAFMKGGGRGNPLDPDKKWRFIPSPELSAKIAKGEKVFAVPGLILGSIKETESLICYIMVPPNFKGGEIAFLSPEGDYTRRLQRQCRVFARTI